jgi:hypothetical protein
MRCSLSQVDKAGIHIDEFFLVDNQSHVFDCNIHELKHSNIRAGVRPIEPENTGDNIIVTKSILPNSLVVCVPANVVQMP